MPGIVELDKVNRDFSNENRRYFLMLENQIEAIGAAKKLGCSLVNVGPVDLVEGRAYLVLSFLWQIVKAGTISRVSKMSKKPSAIDPKVEDERTNDQMTIDDSETALLQLIREHMTIPETCKTLSGFIQNKDNIITLLKLAGAEENSCASIQLAEDDLDHAYGIVQVADELLKEQNIIEVKDIIRSNHEMLTIFIASILELVMTKKTRSDQNGDEHQETMANEETSNTLDDLDFELLDYDLEEIELSSNWSENSAGRLKWPVSENDTDKAACCEHEYALKESQEQITNLTIDKQDLTEHIVELLARLEEFKFKEAKEHDSKGKIEEDLSGISDSESTVGVLIDDIYRNQKQVKIQLTDDKNVVRFRRLMLYSTDFEAIAKAIYGDLSLQNIQKRVLKSGFVRKKDRHALRWRSRFVILRDNFLFCYKEAAKSDEMPVDIYHVDDAMVRIMFEVQSMEDPVISIEIASRVDPFYLYLSASGIQLFEWKESINRAAAWWTS